MIYKLELGDWSEDGHKISESFLFDCNYDIHKIRQAYKDSCKKLGVAFNYNEDYTGLGLGYRSERLIWTEYQESEMSETAFEILNNSGCFKEVDFYKEDGVYYIEERKDCAKLIMNFIALSMPKDFRYKLVQEPKVESINSWNDELRQHFGYGLFD
jgi:hypothetical protein